MHLITAAVTLSWGVATSSAASASSLPVGCLTYAVTSGATRAFSIPLLDFPTITTTATGVTTDTLTVANANWTPNQFASGAVYFAAVRTGPQAGRTLLVVGNTSNALTLDVEDAPLNSSGFAVTAGTDTFELFQGDTLGSLFGTTVDASGFLPSGLKGGTSTSNADRIQLFEGTTASSYFFNTTAGAWVLVNGGTTSRNGLILYPDDGMLLTRRGPTGSLTMVGRAPDTRLLTKFPGGSTTTSALRFPSDTTLGSLNFGAPGTWITGASSSVADTVSHWNGSRWNTYYKNASNQWIRTSGGSDQSALVISAGTSIRINKKGTGTGASAFLGQELPYGL